MTIEKLGKQWPGVIVVIDNELYIAVSPPHIANVVFVPYDMVKVLSIDEEVCIPSTTEIAAIQYRKAQEKKVKRRGFLI